MSCIVNPSPVISTTGYCAQNEYRESCAIAENLGECILLGTGGPDSGTPCCIWDPTVTRTTGCVSGGSCTSENCSQHSSQEECQSNSKTKCACIANPDRTGAGSGPNNCPNQAVCGKPCCKWLGKKSSPRSPRKLGKWAIAGIVVGSLAFIALIIVLRMRKKKAGS
jgi:hypothetical protein